MPQEQTENMKVVFDMLSDNLIESDFKIMAGLIQSDKDGKFFIIEIGNDDSRALVTGPINHSSDE